MKEKVLILGSGALTIGQAGEFDYSGSQAVYSFIDEGFDVIVINPNIATVQTNQIDGAKIYLYPVNAEWVTKVIDFEKPNYIVAGFGGQTAINCLLDLDESKTLEKYNVKVLGSSVETIHATEDRALFSKKMSEIDMPIAESFAVTSIEQGLEVASKIGYPVILRSAYALGGLGSGFADNSDELSALLKKSLSYVPQVLIEKSLQGWKEIEYEVMRDTLGNTICICNMENIDPLGIHTGDSIVVTPSLTISDMEYQILRDASIKIASHLNIIGECNVQFALDPISTNFYVIEANPRLSRSSALASKASGYPIASIAAKVVQGKSLLELKNPITEVTSAFFEPSMDYIALKFPKWDLEKFQGVDDKLSSMMKSIGEIMSIGRSFTEAFQKGLRMVFSSDLGIYKYSFNDLSIEELWLRSTIARPTRMFAVFELLQRNIEPIEIANRTKISAWFIFELKKISDLSKVVQNDSKFKESLINNTLDSNHKELLLSLKKNGFSDEQIAYLINDNYEDTILSKIIRKTRIDNNIKPVIKRIDTSSGEFTTNTNYLYFSYHGTSNDVSPISKDASTIILGGGAYRIGSSVEFDWACVGMSKELQERQKKSIIINCNPETVSTDFSTSDRLYFEELSTERINDIYDFENPEGIIACFGGQETNNLIEPLEEAGLKVLGHNTDVLHKTENRVEFSKILEENNIDQPRWISAVDNEEIKLFVERVGFPLLIRPSFVLSGQGMKVVYNTNELQSYLDKAKFISPKHPVIVTEFLYGASEIDVDGIAKDGKLVIEFLSEHIERAGIHSGDATIVYPARELTVDIQRRIIDITEKLIKATNLNGPFNIQYLVKDDNISVIECNARASRTLPFISKISKVDIIKKTASVLFDRGVSIESKKNYTVSHYGVKAAMFSFSRLDGVDPILGVEMLSTGEAGCIDTDYHQVFLQAMNSTGYYSPQKGILLSTGDESNKLKLLNTVKVLNASKVKLFATPGTSEFYKKHNIYIESVSLKSESNSIDTLLKNGVIDFVVNIPKNYTKEEMDLNVEVRKLSIKYGIQLMTDADKVNHFIEAIEKTKDKKIEVRDLNSF